MPGGARALLLTSTAQRRRFSGGGNRLQVPALQAAAAAPEATPAACSDGPDDQDSCTVRGRPPRGGVNS